MSQKTRVFINAGVKRSDLECNILLNPSKGRCLLDRCRLEDNIKMNFNEMDVKVWCGVAYTWLRIWSYHSGDEVKKTEMGNTYGTYGGEERCMQDFSGETGAKEPSS